MITLMDFWMGRDQVYANELTPEIRSNAQVTVDRANALIARFQAETGNATARRVNSGRRPPAVNAGTKNAAKKSKHMTGQAIDIGDDDEGLDRWRMSSAGRAALDSIGLWLEHPSATPRWCHVQIVPPGSGNRVFYP
jgi:hypothetical protein